MRYEPIGRDLFIKNRERFSHQLKPDSIAIFHSNDLMPTNADGTMAFRQNNDLFYLSGIDQEESVLVVFPDCPDKAHREVLFVRETNEHIAIWEGHKLTKEQVTEISGVETVYWTHEFVDRLTPLMAQAEFVYLNANEHSRANCEVQTRSDRMNAQLRQTFPLHKYERTAPIMHRLRYVKSQREVEMIQRACRITEKAFRRILGFVKPGVMEYEIEAEIIHEFVRRGSRGHAYSPIVASGRDSCVLHYIDNDKACKDGDVLLLDFGAEYGNYNADLTRTIPVNGRFSQRQKAVYNAVLRVMKEAKQMLIPGNTFQAYNKEVGKIMESELIGLGLLDATDVKNQNPKHPLYRKYFMHGTSHSLGLDVHDVDDRRIPFEAGMVFTCEPGIYIPDEGIGVRIENDILVDEKAPVDLMANIPIEAEEIEELMNA